MTFLTWLPVVILIFGVISSIADWWRWSRIHRMRRREVEEFQARMTGKRRNRHANAHNSPEKRYEA